MRHVGSIVALGLRSLVRPGRPPLGFPRLAVGALGGVLALDLLLVTLGAVRLDNYARYFGEGRPGTVATAVALGVAAWMSFAIGRDLRPQRVSRFWMLAGVGFAYLVLDEMFKAHETLDVLLNRAFGGDAEGAHDHLDDLIVAMYSPIVLAIAWPHRLRLLRVRWLVVGVFAATVFFTGMVIFDVRGTRPATEESCKLFAAACFALAVVAARMTYAQRAETAARAGADPAMREGSARRRMRARMQRRLAASGETERPPVRSPR